MRLQYSLPIATTLLSALLASSALAQNGSVVASGATPEVLSDSFTFTEGPIADAQGNVYFTDIPANRIHIWTTDGQLETFREQTSATNGLFFDADGILYGAEGGTGSVTRMDMDGNVSVVVDEYEGASFNSPNDLWIDEHGGIYFTDPRYGLESNLPQPGYYVYYVAPGASEATLIIDDLVRPNGIIGSRDGRTLYVADHEGDETYAYTIRSPGELTDGRLLIEQGSDGMAIDERGNIYLTGGTEITVYSSDGEMLEAIPFPMAPANMTFGGPDRDVLYVTARSTLYALRMTVKGMH